MNIVRKQCFLCWKTYKQKNLFIFSVADRVAEICVHCKNRINDLVPDLPPETMHEMILATNMLVFKVGIERTEAIKLVIKNIGSLDVIEKIGRDHKKMGGRSKPVRMRLHTNHPDEREFSRDIFDRGIRISGSFHSKN
ncbi:hypothetical protein [Neisseria sp. S1]|uniref:hypothetical protein n=1 Tax=Neisseria sp. S1 TaxID=3318354 RepID=UPI003A88EE5B